MKRLMRMFLERKLATYARRVLSRKRPFVVGITGSVGKSSAKQAIGVVLATRFAVRVSPRNYNTELGLPLSVLGEQSGEGSGWRWAKVLLSSWVKSLSGPRSYPDTLVLEMGADHKGDIAKLVAIAPPDVGVVTSVGESHAETLGTVQDIAREKRTVIEKLPADGHAVLNRDDDLVWGMRTHTKAKVISFGFHEDADVRALPETISYACLAEGECGTHVKFSVDGATVPMFINGALGWPGIYAALAATAVGRARGMNLVEITDSFRKYEPPPGRLRYVPGIKRTVLIDDTYNAAPKSAEAALDVLMDIPVASEDDKRFAVLGDMLELGALSDDGHRRVGSKAAELGVDYLILVGERMNEAEKAAREAGMPDDRIAHFGKPEEAGRFVQEKLKQGDVVLVKGSRGMHMEIVVKELMADPLSASRLLVGDHEDWKW